jgi:hypothetical protein
MCSGHGPSPICPPPFEGSGFTFIWRSTSGAARSWSGMWVSVRIQPLQWIGAIVDWYNQRHRQSDINLVKPVQRHNGSAIAIYQQRAEVYEKARRRNPTRLRRHTTHPLLVSTRSGVDQQANKGAQYDSGATLNSGRLRGSRGATPFFKVTGSRHGKQLWPPLILLGTRQAD